MVEEHIHIPPEDLRRVQLSEEHKNILDSFETDETELKKFLIEDALNSGILRSQPKADLGFSRENP